MKNILVNIQNKRSFVFSILNNVVCIHIYIYYFNNYLTTDIINLKRGEGRGTLSN